MDDAAPAPRRIGTSRGGHGRFRHSRQRSSTAASAASGSASEYQYVTGCGPPTAIDESCTRSAASSTGVVHDEPRVSGVSAAAPTRPTTRSVAAE
jgi:hypothetical protein